jgi:hypothetical protein
MGLIGAPATTDTGTQMVMVILVIGGPMLFFWWAEHKLKGSREEELRKQGEQELRKQEEELRKQEEQELRQRVRDLERKVEGEQQHDLALMLITGGFRRAVADSTGFEIQVEENRRVVFWLNADQTSRNQHLKEMAACLRGAGRDARVASKPGNKYADRNKYVSVT